MGFFYFKSMLLNVTYTEWIGYLASLVLIVSFMMKDVNKLRIVNSLGAVLFVIYGIMLQISLPIIITNTFILGVNTYYLLKNKAK